MTAASDFFKNHLDALMSRGQDGKFTTKGGKKFQDSGLARTPFGAPAEYAMGMTSPSGGAEREENAVQRMSSTKAIEALMAAYERAASSER
jgi:hypothetical protein